MTSTSTARPVRVQSFTHRQGSFRSNVSDGTADEETKFPSSHSGIGSLVRERQRSISTSSSFSDVFTASKPPSQIDLFGDIKGIAPDPKLGDIPQVSNDAEAKSDDESDSTDRIKPIQRRSSVKELRLKFSSNFIPEPNDVFQRKFRLSFQGSHMTGHVWNIRTIDSPKKKELLQTWSEALHQTFGEDPTVESAEQFLASHGVTEQEVGADAWDEWKDAVMHVVSNPPSAMNSPVPQNKSIANTLSSPSSSRKSVSSEMKSQSQTRISSFEVTHVDSTSTHLAGDFEQELVIRDTNTKSNIKPSSQPQRSANKSRDQELSSTSPSSSSSRAVVTPQYRNGMLVGEEIVSPLQVNIESVLTTPRGMVPACDSAPSSPNSPTAISVEEEPGSTPPTKQASSSLSLANVSVPIYQLKEEPRPKTSLFWCCFASKPRSSSSTNASDIEIRAVL